MSCHALGAEPATLILAMLGAVGATMYVDVLNDLKRTYGAILLSTLIGGYGTPAALAVSDIYIKRNNLDIPIQTLVSLAPLLSGAAVVILLPYVATLGPAIVRWLFDRGSKS